MRVLTFFCLFTATPHSWLSKYFLRKQMCYLAKCCEEEASFYLDEANYDLAKALKTYQEDSQAVDALGDRASEMHTPTSTGTNTDDRNVSSSLAQLALRRRK